MSLPLDTFRALLGLHPYHFWQLADSGPGALVPIESKCSTLVYEYDWQGSDAAGRESVRTAIADAEWKMLDYLGYRVMPEYTDYDLVDWPRYYEANLSRGADWDATGRRIAVLAGEGYIQAMGVEQLTLIGAAAVGLTVQTGTALYRSFSLTIAVPAGTSADDLAVYFAAADRLGDPAGDRWRIEPLKVTVSGLNATITGDVWLIVQPSLYEAIPATVLDPTDASVFVSSLEVYTRTTNGNGSSVTTAQSTLVYETNDCGSCWGSACCCYGGTVSSDPGTTGEVIARAGIRDAVNGLITPAAAIYNGATWSSVWCCAGFCEPDRVKLRYLAGYPLEGRQMARRFRDPTAWLAAAELKRRVCACREQNEKLHDLQQDLTLESTQSERYAVPQGQLDNPFGTRRGHVQAWKAVQDVILRRGISA